MEEHEKIDITDWVFRILYEKGVSDAKAVEASEKVLDLLESYLDE